MGKELEENKIMFVYTCECGQKNELKDPCVCEKCGKEKPVSEKLKLFISLFKKLSKTEEQNGNKR